jgi:bifunctional DNase/RNase
MVPDELVRVSVSNVRVAVATSPGVEAGMVTLREDGPPYRDMSIIIGQPEARAILSAWSGTTYTRPTTWDLFVSAIAVLEGRIERVIITAVEEKRHFFATLELERDGQRRVLSARPSDGIALALRDREAEIFVNESVIAEIGVSPASEHSN